MENLIICVLFGYLGPHIGDDYIITIFRKTNLPWTLIRIRTGAFQEVRNISFSEKFVYVFNEWSLDKNPKLAKKAATKNDLCKFSVFRTSNSIKRSDFSKKTIHHFTNHYFCRMLFLLNTMHDFSRKIWPCQLLKIKKLLTLSCKLHANKPNPWNIIIFHDKRKTYQKTDGSIKKLLLWMRSTPSNLQTNYEKPVAWP